MKTIKTKSTIMISLILFVFCFLPEQVLSQGKIMGTVIDAKTKEPLANVNVVIKRTDFGAATDLNGEYIIENIPFGEYKLEASHLGYETEIKENVAVNSTNPILIHFELKEGVRKLSEVVVAAGQFSMIKSSPGSKVSLSKENIKATALYGGDIYRAITRLPGVVGNDYNAKFTVRGGDHDEVLVLFDGIELYDPFHVKDFGGVLSIIDVEAIGGVNLLTGGFPAEYGRRKSGIFDINTSTGPIAKTHTSAGLSFMNARFLTEGPISGDKGRWLVSARRGFIDYALKLTGEDDELLPQYYDIMGKVEYELNMDHIISAHFLTAGDKLLYVDDDDNESHSSYDNTYGWLKLKSFFGDNIFANTVLSTGIVNHDRKSFFSEIKTDMYDTSDIWDNFGGKDDRGFAFFSAKQDWNIDLSSWSFLKAGIEYKDLTSDYDYTSFRIKSHDYLPIVIIDSVNTKSEPNGTELGAFVSNRIRIFDPLTVEVGVRYDEQSYIEGSTTAPRVNVAYTLGKNTVIKAAWGEFYQTQGIHELNIQDGDSTFYEAEKSIHRLIGFEHRFGFGVDLRIEAYRKNLHDIRPRYRNAFNNIDVFPETSGDRFLYEVYDGKAEGLEILLKKDTGGKLSWWLSYSLTKAEDYTFVNTTQYTYPKSFDQRHTVDFNFNYRPDENWRLNFTWLFHTGWPYTGAEVAPYGGKVVMYAISATEYNEFRLPSYHRFDIRVTRNFKFKDQSIGVFAEVINVLNRRNVRNVDFRMAYPTDSCILMPIRNDHHWLRTLPSIGFSWDR